MRRHSSFSASCSGIQPLASPFSSLRPLDESITRSRSLQRCQSESVQEVPGDSRSLNRGASLRLHGAHSSAMAATTGWHRSQVGSMPTQAEGGLQSQTHVALQQLLGGGEHPPTGGRKSLQGRMSQAGERERRG